MCVTLVEDGLDLMEQRLTLCRGKRLSGREGGVLRTDVLAQAHGGEHAVQQPPKSPWLSTMPPMKNRPSRRTFSVGEVVDVSSRKSPSVESSPMDHVAYVANLKPRRYWKRSTPFMRPMIT